jgi:hypothetical protein
MLLLWLLRVNRYFLFVDSTLRSSKQWILA